MARTRLIQKIKEKFKKANKKSNEIAQISRLKLDIIAVKKEIEERLFELGGMVYERFREEEIPDLMRHLPERHILEQIKELEKELNAYKEQLEQLKNK